jgi:phage terminase large subunit-like protein
MWDACGGAAPEYSHLAAIAGFDLGHNRDMTALGYVFELEPDGENRRFVIECDVFIPRGSKVQWRSEPFKTWIADGFLTVTDTKGTDFAALYGCLTERQRRHGVLSMAYDPKAATEFAGNCTSRLDINTSPFLQNKLQYTEPLDSFIEALVEQRIFHNNNPILGWCARNMAVESDSTGSYRMPSKEKSDDKIDPLIAVLMAYGTALLQEPEPVLDYYESNPVEIV